MIRDFSSQVLDLKGKPVQVGGSVATLLEAIDKALSRLAPDAAEILKKEVAAAIGEPLILGSACADALVAALPGEDGLPIGKRSERLALAVKICKGERVEIKPEERDLMKQCVTAYYRGALIPGRIAELLETDPSPQPGELVHEDNKGRN